MNAGVPYTEYGLCYVMSLGLSGLHVFQVGWDDLIFWGGSFHPKQLQPHQPQLMLKRCKRDYHYL